VLFQKFSDTVCWFIEFFSVCAQYQTFEGTLGSLFVGELMKIGGVNRNMCILSRDGAQVSTNMSEIECYYDAQKLALENGMNC